MQTIVHTPHGIHTMGAHGHMSALTTTPSTTAPTLGGGLTTIVSPMGAAGQPGAVQTTSVSSRPIPIPLPAGGGISVAGGPSSAAQPLKFTPGGTALPQVKTESAPILPQLPQQPAPAHIQVNNKNTYLTYF